MVDKSKKDGLDEPRIRRTQRRRSVNKRRIESQAVLLLPHSPLPSGLFHSQENQGFVGVVPPCRPSPSTISCFRDWGRHGGRPLQENETALPLPSSPLATQNSKLKTIPHAVGSGKSRSTKPDKTL